MNFFNFSNIDSLEDIKSLFRDNIKILEYLDEYEGFDNFLGSGEYGKVWKIKGKELTLKITRDELEIESSKKLAGKNTKGFLKIYSTVEVGNIQLKLQEMCYPTQNSEIGPFVISFFYQVVEEGEEIEKTVENFKNWYKVYEDGFGKEKESLATKLPSDSEIERYLKFTENLFNDCKKFLNGIESFEELDVHKDNIMQTKTGELKLVDF